MSITFMPYIYEANDGVWRIPASCDLDDDDRLSINMANSNAVDVLECLGYPDMSMSDQLVPIQAFLTLTTSVLRQLIDQPSPAIEIRTSGGETGLSLGAVHLGVRFSIGMMVLYTTLLNSDQFGRLTGIGRATNWVPYCHVNLGVIMGLIPVGEITLLRVSFGQSALTTVIIGFGVVTLIHVHRGVEFARGEK